MNGDGSYLSDVRSILSRCEALYDRIRADEASAGGTLAKLSRALFDAAQIVGAAVAAAEAESRAETGDESDDDLLASADVAPPAAAAAVDDAACTADAAEGPGGTEVVELGGALAKVIEVVDAGRLAIDPADLRFAAKVREILAAMDDAQRAGEKGARVLADCVRFLDVLDHEYVAPGYEQLAATASDLRARLAEYLDAGFGVRFTPDPRETGADGPDALASLSGAKQVRYPSPEPAGRPLGLVKRGMSIGGRSEPPEILVSTGSTTPAFELISRVARAILRPMNVPREVLQARALAFKEIRRKYLPELIGADVEHESTVIRYVANLLQPLNRDDALGEIVKRLVAELAERGIKQIPLRIGTMFDDSYGTTKFERKMVSSDKPKGMIVAALQLGFVNRDGVPIQKAVLGVSGGPAL